jgi:choline dehydrogenase-like flavoprotein
MTGNKQITTLTTSQRFDHIVVGGGTAGCVMAAQLSQDPDCQPLVLEAGAASVRRALAERAWCMPAVNAEAIAPRQGV